jgi:dolichol-phosphate mannosyltransferase
MLSVVVPMYNEEQVLPLFAERLRPVLDGLDHPYEVLVVDDGSADLTPALLLGLRRTWPELRVVRLRMNSGHQAALSAGLDLARGDHVVSIDADLQDPPELIPAMLATAIREQVDVVYGVRTDRSTDSRLKRSTARLFYRVTHRLTGGQAHREAGDFRLMSRAVVDAVNSLPASGRVLRFVVPALGFPSAVVEYRREARAAGTTKYGIWRMVQLSLDSITGVSTAPLRIASITGLAGAVMALIVGLTTVIAHYAGSTLPGWTSTVAIVAAFGALQLLCLGILGEYLGRTYQYLQDRPTYYVATDSLEEPLLETDERSSGQELFRAAQTTEEPNGRSTFPRSVRST